jgi:replication factor A1
VVFELEMTTDHVIASILSQHPEITREEITEQLEKERRRTNGFISEKTLLRMIAARLGMRIQNGEISTPRLSLADLVPSLSHVTVVGRVVAVLSTKTFNRNRSGKLASLLLVDSSGMLRVVLWNDKTSLIESGGIKVGQIIRVSHGYTKEGHGGVELHVGEKCQIEINPQEVDAKGYPTVDKFMTRIGELSFRHLGKKVCVTGIVRKLFSPSAFEKQDLSLGRVVRLVLADGASEVSVVVWNEKVDELETRLKEGMSLQIVNGKVRKALREGLEVHVDSSTYVETCFPR